LFVPISANSNQLGASEVTLPIPRVPALRTARLFVQFFWGRPTAPPTCPPLGMSASHAFEILIQP